MAYRYRSRRSVKRLARKSKHNFIITIVLIVVLGYAMLSWILPFFIGGIGAIKNAVNPSQKIVQTNENSLLAPPVLNIPYQATNSAEINIKGFGSPDSKVKIFIDDEEKSTVDVSSDGSFIADNISLNLGLNNIFAKTVDENKKESLPSKTITLTYAFDKPNLTINQPEDNKKIQGGDKKVTVSGKTDPGMKIFINNSQVIVSNDGNFSNEISINEGDNTISVRAQDDASNTSEVQRKVTYSP